MYIPSPFQDPTSTPLVPILAPHGPPAAAAPLSSISSSSTASTAPILHRLLAFIPGTSPLRFARAVDPSSTLLSGLVLRPRNTPLQQQQVTVGVVVGVLLALFIIGTCLFLARYGVTIRSMNKRHRRRASRHTSKASSTASASSASSQAGSGEGAAA